MKNDNVKTCAIVQGNIRRGCDEVIPFLARHFDLVILSTWKDESVVAFLDQPGIIVVQSEKPEVAGFSHRNFQRASMAAGLKVAETEHCTHVLKWRTDMLPTKLNVQKLLQQANYSPSQETGGRVVTCAFRHLSVNPDWFSSVPDLFAFSDIAAMKLLWGDEGFHYNEPLNPPKRMLAECGQEWLDRDDVGGYFCSESELYAIYKDRIEQKTARTWSHPRIAKKLFYLVDHQELGICWFEQTAGFRSIPQALEHPWWTPRIWQSKQSLVSIPGYPDRGFWFRLRGKYLTRWVVWLNIKLQNQWYKRYEAIKTA